MQSVDFETRFVKPRKDLLHFVEENADKEIYQKLGAEPKRWLEELGILNGMLTKSGDEVDMVGMRISMPPKDDPKFSKIGENAYLYRGDMKRLGGLWIYDQKDAGAGHGELYDWTQYKMGTSATLRVNKKFADIPSETLLPENFLPKSKAVKTDKRPVLSFDIERNGDEMTVFAKGSEVRINRYMRDARPSFRLTDIAQIGKNSSLDEMYKMVGLSEKGVRTPEIIGHYDSLTEDFLFTRKVDGETPDKYVDSERYTFLEQDAQMLAGLCMSGQRKHGFADFDDKIFDGHRLYLVDVDEVMPIYSPDRPDFAAILANPSDKSAVKKFRSYQRSLFEGALRDTLFNYRDTLKMSGNDMRFYVESFYDAVGWKSPSKKAVEKMTSFPEDYMTFERHMNLMMDTG